MRKTVLAPGYGELSDGSEPATSLGQVLHRPEGLEVTLSGALAPTFEGGVEAQAREVFSYVREVICDDLGGELADVTHLRLFVREDVLDDGTRAALHRVRRQTFEWPHYPSATLVGVATLARDDALVEVEIEAFLPDDGWETEVLEPAE